MTSPRALVRYLMAYTSDLFPAELGVVGSFDRAFSCWESAAVAADRLQRDSTRSVYRDMWGSFKDWCVEQSPQVTLESLTEEDIHAFLSSRTNDDKRRRELSVRYTWRLLSLIDRVLTRHALDTDQPKNEAAASYIKHSDDIRRANISERPALDYLDAEQARRLVTYLSSVRPGATERRVVTTWQELRAVAAVALHLGAGLTPVDLRELTLASPVVAGGRWKDVPWKLKVPGNGNRRARETPVAPWAGQLLRQWITTRAEIGLPSSPHLDAKGEPQGPFLFPGRGGQLWAKMSHYEAVKQVMEASGVDDPQSGSGGAFRLRHTFALRQLRRKRSVEEVARWMGIANLEEMDRYRVVLDAYEEAV